MSAPPTEDEFLIWKDNHVTLWVLAGVQRFADAQQPDFAAKAWSASPDDWEDLRLARERIKARQDAYEGFANLTYEQAVSLYPAVDGPDPDDGNPNSWSSRNG